MSGQAKACAAFIVPHRFLTLCPPRLAGGSIGQSAARDAGAVVDADLQRVYLLVDVLSAYPSQLAVVKVLFVVVGHLLAVVAAHDCALRVLPAEHRLTGQLGMLLLMVAITYTGLFLLLTS